MPPENDPKTQDPRPEGQDPKPAQTSPLPPGGLTFNRPLFDGDLTGTLTQPSPTQYQGIASYLFKNGDGLGANALLGTQPWMIEQYGLNGDFGIGSGGRAKFGFDAAPPKDTYKWLTDIKFGDGSLFNADLTKTPKGEVFNANGLWKIDKEQQLSGTALFNSAEKLSDIGLKWNHTDKHFFNFGLNDTPAGTIVKGDGQATLKPGELLTGSAELNGVTKTNDFKLNWNDNGNHFLNLGLNDSPAGSIFKADGKTTLKPGELLTGSAELNGVTKTNDFKLNWNDNGNHFLNLGLNDSPAGSIFKADGKTTLKPGELLTGSAELNGVEKFTDLKFKWNDNDKHLFNFDYWSNKDGTIVNTSGLTTLKSGGVLKGSGEFNGIENFTDLKLSGNFNEKHTFNLNYKDTPAGSLFKADGKTTFGSGDILTGMVNINNVEKFKEYSLGYGNLGGTKFDFGLKDLPGGSIYSADAKVMLDKKDYLTGNLLINNVEKTKEFGVGANIKDNVYNFNLSQTPFGTNFGLGAKLSFDDGKGMVDVNGKYGPKLSEANGSISYKFKDLEYSGNVKFNNANGPFGLAELGAKLSKGDDRFKYGIEASVNPHTGDYKVMAGISISFGGGSKRMSAPEPSYSPPSRFDRNSDFAEKPVSADKQAIDRLNPNDRVLFDQAKAGVEKLNAQGASFNVEKTAMYLAALGNEKGFAKIEKVELGKPMLDGRQNLFIFDREPTHPMVKSAPADPALASNTPVRASADLLQRTPDILDARSGVAKTEPPVVANPEAAAAKRGY